MYKEKVVVLMVGPSGSGKSAYARERYSSGFIISHSNPIERKMQESWKSYQAIWSKDLENLAYAKVEHRYMEALLQKKPLIVVDQPNIDASIRKFYVVSARALGYKIIMHVMPRKSIEALVLDSEWDVPEEVIRKQVKTLTLAPGEHDYSKGFRKREPLAIGA